MIVLDVVAALGGGVEGVSDLALGGLAGERWSVVRLGPGGRWDAAADRDRAALVLEGVATVFVDDARQSVASGHLLLVAAGSPLGVLNDGAEAVSLLVRTAEMAAP